MSDFSHRKSFPRCSELQAIERLKLLSGASVEKASELASSNFEGMRFHHTPEQIVSEAELALLRTKAVELATKFGFPENRIKIDGQNKNQFDTELASLLFNEMQIIPAEAADDEVWWFITLFLLPDVAMWRFPLPAEISIENPSTWHVRFMDSRRGLFRQAWWRYFLLGEEACGIFLEDEFLNLIDRVALSGFRPLAQALCSEFIERIRGGNYPGAERRSVFRLSMILARRALGYEAIYAMDTDRISNFAKNTFDKAEDLIRNKKSKDLLLESTDEETIASEGSLTSFLSELGDISKLLLPFISKPDLSEQMIFELREMLPVYARLHPENVQVGRISQDLEHLLMSIHSLDREFQIIVYAATAYFLLAEDAIPDSSPGGFDDDEFVLETAFKFLQLSRPSSSL